MNDPLEIGRVRQYRRDLRRGLRDVVVVCAVALAITGLAMCGPGDARIAGAQQQQSFEEWYADEENRAWYEFHQWYSAHYRNSSYYHIRDEFGTGYTGDRAIQIAECESRLNPRAISKTDDHGVLQLNRPSWERKFAAVTGVSWNDGVYHASHNAKFAKWLHDQTGGFSHWACA